MNIKFQGSNNKEFGQKLNESAIIAKLMFVYFPPLLNKSGLCEYSEVLECGLQQNGQNHLSEQGHALAHMLSRFNF